MSCNLGYISVLLSKRAFLYSTPFTSFNCPFTLRRALVTLESPFLIFLEYNFFLFIRAIISLSSGPEIVPLSNQRVVKD